MAILNKDMLIGVGVAGVLIMGFALYDSYQDYQMDELRLENQLLLQELEDSQILGYPGGNSYRSNDVSIYSSEEATCLMIEEGENLWMKVSDLYRTGERVDSHGLKERFIVEEVEWLERMLNGRNLSDVQPGTVLHYSIPESWASIGSTQEGDGPATNACGREVTSHPVHTYEYQPPLAHSYEQPPLAVDLAAPMPNHCEELAATPDC